MTLGAGAADAFVGQLVRLFGHEAGWPLGAVVADWGRDPITAAPTGTLPAEDGVPPSVHALAAGPWTGRLASAGAETYPEHWGLLEGALGAGHRAAERTLTALRRS